MALTQTDRSIFVSTPLEDDELVITRMRGQEALGRLFEFHLDLLSENHDIAIDDVLGGNMTVGLSVSSEVTRYFNGFVAHFSYIGPVGRYAGYAATLRPWTWFLTRTADCRIFQDVKVADIVKEIFRDHGFSDFEDTLADEYRTWEYCVQYRETDFDFVSRLMEHEGIYYYFRHENGRHILVLSDGIGSHETVSDYEEVPFLPALVAGREERDHVSSWQLSGDMQPAAFALTDFDFKAPRKDLRTRLSMTGPHAPADLEVYDYPGDYIEPGEGERYVRVRMEEKAAQYETVHGVTNARGLSAGTLFDLTEYPREDQNRQYLIVSASYDLQSDAYQAVEKVSPERPYQSEFTAIASRLTFRPSRTTVRPVVEGPQTAIVVGPAGEEIETDEWGRVKVRFHWDRYDETSESGSCWIRVAQSAAGKHWGAMHVPRIGQEVIVDFLEGDPDRPIITGRVYNEATPPPYELPSHDTMTTFKSNSSKGGQGFNELRFEDRKGEEQIFVHAEKNQDIRVKNDRYEWTGRNRHLIVKQDKFEHIENNRNDKIGNDLMQDIGKDLHLKVAGKQAAAVTGSYSLTVDGNVMQVFKADHSEQTTGTCYLKAMGVVIEATSGITLKCGGGNVVIDPAGVTLKGGMITLDGQLVNIASGPGSPASSASAGSAVSPALPPDALEADNADPGKVAELVAAQQASQTGKYGSEPATAFTGSDQEEDRSWIEIELVDEEDNPVPSERYEIELPDGSVASGTLDENGFARVDGIDPGTCQVTFPDLDQEAWERA